MYQRTFACVALLLLPTAFGCSEKSQVVSSPRYSQAHDSSFVVGASAILEVSNFAGNTRVTPGASGVIEVTARKWAGRADHLSEIEIEMEAESDTVSLRTANPSGLNGVSVDLDVTVPAGTRPVLGTGAGSLSYEGRPMGECAFSMGAGDITLKLPADVNVQVLLSVGAGSIQVDFAVNGQVGQHLVDGVIGTTGADGTIVAHSGAGKISVLRQQP